MKPIPVLGIPHYNRPDLTARCIASIDYPVDMLVIVLNGGRELEWHSTWHMLVNAVRANSCINGQIRASHHPNAGVAGAWNEIIKLFPAPWWLISNNDIQFAPGDLAKMAAAVWPESDRYEKLSAGCLFTGEYPAAMFYGNHGASWFAITRSGVDQVGLFDENIYPAYLEDCDWSRRSDLVKARRLNVPDVHAVHGDGTHSGSCTILSNPAIRAENHRTHGGNFEYYRAKWGGDNGHEIFTNPFNQLDWPVWAWKFDPAFRQRQQWAPSGAATI